ncbi:MAG: sensor histidine kinase [Pseudomonadota bacterium]
MLAKIKETRAFKNYYFLVPYLFAMLSIACLTVSLLPFYIVVSGKPGIFAFTALIIIIWIALSWGKLPAIFTLLIGATFWQHFFLHLTTVWSLYNIQNWVLFIAFITSSLTVGHIASQVLQRAIEAEKNRLEIERLYIDLQQENKERQRIEALLRKVPNALKAQVFERTKELKEANQQLELEILERKQIEQQLLESREQLRAHSTYIETVREEERKRIAIEVHDELGQLLTALKMNIALLRNQFKDNPIVFDKLSDSLSLLKKTIYFIRNLVSQLRPSALNLGLIAALEWLADNFNQHSLTLCKTDIRCEDINFLKDETTIIFRIAQEALTNVMRHAEATEVMLSVIKYNNRLELSIRDNGKGFNLKNLAHYNSYGLFGMKERALSINANLNIESKLGEGTHIFMHIPFEETPLND